MKKTAKRPGKNGIACS